MSDNNLSLLKVYEQSNSNFFNKYNYQEVTIKFNLSYLGYVYFPLILICLFSILFYNLKLENSIKYPLFISLIAISLVLAFLICWFNSRKIVLRKDEPNNLLQVQSKNIFGRSIKSLVFNLQNIIADIIFYNHKVRRQKEKKYYAFILVNKGNNITFNDNIIPQVPEKLYYIFENVNINKSANKETLKDFIEWGQTYENPVFFNALTYMKNYRDYYSYFEFLDYKLSRFMKMNERFFAFYVDNKFFSKFGYLLLIFIFNTLIISGAIPVIKKKSIREILMVVAAFVIINLIIFLVIYRRIQKIQRIDIIYSNNFDKMFIGLVNYNEKKYKKTFSFDINSIDKFILVEKKANKFGLKVVYNNTSSIEICNLFDIKSKLEPLLYILNEKLNRSL